MIDYLALLVIGTMFGAIAVFLFWCKYKIEKWISEEYLRVEKERKLKEDECNNS